MNILDRKHHFNNKNNTLFFSWHWETECKKRNKIISAAATAGTASFTHVSHSVKDQNKPNSCSRVTTEEEVTVTSVIHEVPRRAVQQSQYLGSKKKKITI